ncbi:radical SAM protein [Acidianus sp. RZ1]|uniref:B12-binding domain-containing radical SAM protein n=1 Tax=Acidianus sp. RZ1 TaxID=1540082 RepID=UPI001491428A|nr:radical SAM protein [Acidianus sp. RZ1]NON61346.1 B12-binding domain-containing radical SAM protein [Acidianus sp. RZ1]
MSYDVILSSDRGSFTDYGGTSVLGYVACMPSRIVPRLFMDKFFTPRVKTDKDGKALIAPYALRKIEAVLVNSGFKVAVVPPEKIDKFIDKTKIIGITAHDPFGLNPVSAKLSFLFGGGPTWTAKFFEEFGEKLELYKDKYHFKVIAGGPGAWELSLKKPKWVDTVFIGEAEVDFPELVKRIVNGESELPAIFRGRNSKLEEIPPIVNPARLGEVQITRGCPRGCKFCSITPETFRSIPLDVIKREVEVNLRSGRTRVEFITDDVMLYGSSKLKPNHDAIVKLFTEVMNMGVDGIWFPHISAPAVRESPKTVRSISEISHYDTDRAAAPVVGLESGSLRILEKYMTAKAFPWTVREWKNIIIDATAIMNENFIYPCYTMTIGYPEETEDDVEKSIDLVQSIIDHKFTAWIFPLPVIPISTTYISKNAYPTPKSLPSNYWDLLYISWKYDLQITRELIPVITSAMQNRFVRYIVQKMIDKIFSSIEFFFTELKKTKGEYSKDLQEVNLNNASGVIKSIYWLIRLSIRPLNS